MATREERKALQEKLRALQSQANEEMKKLPGVVGVGIGFKETGGKLTKEITWRVFVTKKKSPSEIADSEKIPETLLGYKTDVLKVEESDLHSDHSRYRPILGGIKITNNAGSWGTLGCLAKLNDSEDWVAVSNHHVMLGSGVSLGDHVKIGQPDHSTCCCCACCEIGEVVAGSRGGLVDCAIAKLDSDVERLNEIIEIGAVKGTETAVVGDPIKKRGVTTELTKGEVADVSYITTSGEFSFTDQIRVVPAPDEDVFREGGDSGSAYVYWNDEDKEDEKNGKIVGIHWGGKPGRGVGSHIAHVESAMNISIQANTGSSGGSVTSVLYSHRTNTVSESYPELAAETGWNWSLNHPGVVIVEKHWPEVWNLINQCRAVTITWQRNQGPAFVAAFLRSRREPNYVVPQTINGISFTQLLMNMHIALEENGSDSLRSDVRTFGFEIIDQLRHCDSFALLKSRLHQLGEIWNEYMVTKP